MSYPRDALLLVDDNWKSSASTSKVPVVTSTLSAVKAMLLPSNDILVPSNFKCSVAVPI